MDGTALVKVFSHCRIFDDLDNLHLPRLLGVLNRLANLQGEPARHRLRHVREKFGLQDAVQEWVSLLCGADAK